MKRILITGTSGLLGKALINAMDLKDSIILAPQRKDLDLTDNLMVKCYFESNKIDLVLHCAAVVGGIQANIENPYYILSTNLTARLIMGNKVVNSNVNVYGKIPKSTITPLW